MSFFGKIFGLKPTAASKQDKVEKHLEVGRSAEPRVYSGKRLSMFEKLTYNFKSLFERTFSLNLGIQARNISGLRALTAAKVDPIAVFMDLSAAVRDMPGTLKEKKGIERLPLDLEGKFAEQVNELSNEQLMRLGNNLNILRSKNFYGSLRELRDDKRQDLEVRRLCQFNLDLLVSIETIVSDRLGVKEKATETLTFSTSEPGESLLQEEERVVIDYDMKLMNALKKEALNQKGLNRAHQQQEAAIRLLAPTNLIDTLKQSNEPGDIFKALSMEVIRSSFGLVDSKDEFEFSLNNFIQLISEESSPERMKDLGEGLKRLIQNGWLQAFDQLIAKEKEEVAQKEKAQQKKGGDVNAVNRTVERLLEHNKRMLEKIMAQFGENAFADVKPPNQSAIDALANKLTTALDKFLTPVYRTESKDPAAFKAITDALNNPSSEEKRTIPITVLGITLDVPSEFDRDAPRWTLKCKVGDTVFTLSFKPDKIKGYEALLEFVGYDKNKPQKAPENQAAIKRFQDLTLLSSQRSDGKILEQISHNQYLGPIHYQKDNDKEGEFIISGHGKIQTGQGIATQSGERTFVKTEKGFSVIVEGKQHSNSLWQDPDERCYMNPLTTALEYRVKFDYNETTGNFFVEPKDPETYLGVTI